MANENIGIKGWRNYSSFSLFAAGSARADKNTAILVDTFGGHDILEPEPTDPYGGNLSVVSTDWVLAGRIPCPITRTYNHQDTGMSVDHPFGPCWSWQYDMELFGDLNIFSAGKVVTWKAADGSEYDFTWSQQGATYEEYTSPAGMHQYTLRFHRTGLYFDLIAGKLLYRFVRNMNTERALLMWIRTDWDSSFDGPGLIIQRYTDGSGYPMPTIEYIQTSYHNGTSWTTHNIIQPIYDAGLIVKLRLLDSFADGKYLELNYTYADYGISGRLAKVEPKWSDTTPLNMEIEYRYNVAAPHQMVEIRDTNGAKHATPYGWTINYNAANQVSSVVFPVDDGVTGTVSYAYDQVAPGGWPGPTSPPTRITEVTDAVGNVWRYQHDGAGRVVYSADPLYSGTRYTQYTYNADNQITGVNTPKPNSGEAGRLNTLYYYNSSKNLAAVVDPYGFVSWYKYGTRASYDTAGTDATVDDVIGIFTVAPGQAAYADGDHTVSETIQPSGMSSPLNVDSYVSWDAGNLYWKYADGTTPTPQVIQLARTVIDYTYTTGTGKLTSLRSCSPADFAEASPTSYTLTTASGASGQTFNATTGDLTQSYTPRQFKDSGTYGYTAYTHDEIYGVVTEVENADSILASAGKKTVYTYNGLRTRVLTVTLPESVSDSQVTTSVYDSNGNEFLLGTERTDIGSWGVTPQLNINEYDYNGNLIKVWQADPDYASSPRWDGNSAHGYNEVRGASYDRINRAISSYVKVDWNQDTTVDTLTTETTYDLNGNVTRVKGPAFTAMDSSTKFTYNFTEYDALGRAWKVYVTTADASSNLTTPPSNYTEYHYDLVGNITIVYDPMYIGTETEEAYHKTMYEYDWLNRRISTTANYKDEYDTPVPISTEQHFDASGGVYWSADGKGYKTYPQRDLSGRLVSVHRGSIDGDRDLREYDADGHLEFYCSYEDVASGTKPLYRTRNEYDALGRLVNSGREQYDVDSETWINWNSNTADATFNYNGWALRSYDKVNTGKYAEREYDNWGQLTKLKVPAVPDPSSPAADIVYETEYRYNVLGQRIRTDDHEDNSTYYFYDLLGRQIKVRNALTYETKTYYDARSLKWKVERPSTAVTEYLYNDARQLAEQQVHHDSTTDTTEYAYNLNGQVTQVDYPNGGVDKFSYDKLGRRSKSETLLEHGPVVDVFLETLYTFDDNNRVVQTTAPGGYVYQYVFDDLGNLSSSTDPASETTTYTYDKDNRLVTKTDPVGVATTNTYDWKTGRVLSVLTEINDKANEDIAVSYSYDNNGHPTAITDGRDYVWEKAYDALGRMVSLATPNPGDGAYTHTITYDGNGNITKTIDFKGGTHHYAYDALNRMSGHGASSPTDETYTYGCGRKLTSYTDSLGGGSMTYDQLGRLLTHTNFTDQTVIYTYDSMGRIATLTPPQGTNFRTEYEYNENGSLKLVRIYDNGTPAVTSYTYDTEGSGKLKIRNFPEESGQYIENTHSYDGAGRLYLEAYTNVGGSGAGLSRTCYTYGISGYQRTVTRTEQTFSSGSWHDSWRVIYAWDGLGRQVSETRENYSFSWSKVYGIEQEYDKNGNRTHYNKEVASRSEDNYGNSVDLRYTYDAVNGLQEIADAQNPTYAARVTCDANGNITHVYETQGGTADDMCVAVLSTQFSYDGLNRLVEQYTRNWFTEDVYNTKRYHQYDGLGRLINSALTQWISPATEPSAVHRHHMYAGSRHIGNAYNDGMATTYGASWYWAGGQQEHAAPLKSPNPDTAGQAGYNVADAQSPQKETWLNPTTTGDEKHLFGQGRPMAWQASGAGANYAYGKASQDGTATANMESWLMFDGTVVDSAAANDLSRITDAREKGRIGIFGNALSYAGSYGRVTSESIGRDLNPLGRGDGNAAVGGGLNLGVINPVLPGNSAFLPGGGNSTNYGREQPLVGGYGGAGAGRTGTVPSAGGSNPSNKGEDSECDGPCHGIRPPTKELCGNTRINNCFGLTRSTNPVNIDCHTCLVSWEEEWCKGRADYGLYTIYGGGSVGGDGGSTGGSWGGRPIGVDGGGFGPGGGTTGPWGPGAGGGSKPAAPGWWAAFQGMLGGGNGRGGLYDPGAMQLLGGDFPREIWGRTQDEWYHAGMQSGNYGYKAPKAKSYAYNVCCKCISCSSKDCDWLEKLVREADNFYKNINHLVLGLGIACGIASIVAPELAPLLVAVAILYGAIAYAAAYYAYIHKIQGSLPSACYQCIRSNMGTADDLDNEAGAILLGSLLNLLGLIPGGWGVFSGLVASGLYWGLPTNPWHEWIYGPREYPEPAPMPAPKPWHPSDRFLQP